MICAGTSVSSSSEASYVKTWAIMALDKGLHVWMYRIDCTHRVPAMLCMIHVYTGIEVRCGNCIQIYTYIVNTPAR